MPGSGRPRGVQLDDQLARGPGVARKGVQAPAAVRVGWGGVPVHFDQNIDNRGQHAAAAGEPAGASHLLARVMHQQQGHPRGGEPLERVEAGEHLGGEVLPTGQERRQRVDNRQVSEMHCK